MNARMTQTTLDTPRTTETQTLAPSEVVVLRATEFVGKPGIYRDTVELPDGQKVSSGQLSKAALSAAVLAMEQAGAVAVSDQKGRQGLMPTTFVLLSTGPAAASWPLHSAEAQMAARLAQGPLTVQDLVFALLQKRASDPDQLAVQLIEDGLVARGLLTQEKTKRLMVLTTVRYHLADHAAEVVAHQPVEPIKRLLEDCKTGRADLWKRLHDQIKIGIEARGPATD